MALRGGEILTKEQRLEYTRIPDDLSEEKIAAYYTLSSSDIAIVNPHRRDYNRLDFALEVISAMAALIIVSCILITQPHNIIEIIAKIEFLEKPKIATGILNIGNNAKEINDFK